MKLSNKLNSLLVAPLAIALFAACSTDENLSDGGGYNLNVSSFMLQVKQVTVLVQTTAMLTENIPLNGIQMML